jgi:sugar lactone lactonase YvrE
LAPSQTTKVAVWVSFVVFACLAVFASPASASLVRTGGWESHSHLSPFNLSSVAVDGDGNAYVADYGLTRIVKIESDGSSDLNWGVGEPGPSFPPNPVDLAVDDDGNVYALDMGGKQVLKYSPEGELLTSWSIDSPYYGGRWSITWESGRVWVLTEVKISEFLPDGTPVPLDASDFKFDSIPSFVTPMITGDGDGHLVVSSADWCNPGVSATKSIYRFDTDGVLLSKWPQSATVDHVSLPKDDYTFVNGYFNLAVDPSGNIWVSASGTDHRFKKVDASGLLPGGAGDSHAGGDLTIDSQNRYWTIGSDPDYSPSDQVRRAAADGSDFHTWGEADFPDYADQVWPDSFNKVDDFSIDSSGDVAILDFGLHRVKIFTSEGIFIRSIKLPIELDNSPGYLSWVDLADDGTVEVYEGHTGRFLRFDNSGDPAGEATFEIPGSPLSVDRTSEGGHLFLTDSGVVKFFDAADQEVGSWNLARALPPVGEYRSAKALQGPDGDVYVVTPDYLDRYSATGEHLATWSLRDEECTIAGSDGFVDLAIDTAGNVYATASLVRADRWKKIYAFDPDLNLIWSDNSDWGLQLKTLPDGSFLSVGQSIDRIAHTGDDDPGLVTSCREQPVPDHFKLLAVKYGRNHVWAKLRVHVPNAGKLVVNGPKVRRRVRKVRRTSNYAITVKAKARFLRPDRPRRHLKLRVRLTFKSESGVVHRHLKLRLKGKLTHRKPAHRA